MEENKNLVVQTSNNSLNMFDSKENFNTVFTMAQTLAKSSLIPDNFRGKPENVMIAIDMSQRMKINPLMVMQNLYIVNGNPSFSASFLISCINTSGKFQTSLRFVYEGQEGTDDWGCYAYAIDKNGEVVRGSKFTIKMARLSGLFEKKGTKWTIEPEQMLKYRAASRFQKAFCPEILCGLSVDTGDYDEYVEITDNPTLTEEPPLERKKPQSVEIADEQTKEPVKTESDSGSNHTADNGEKKSTETTTKPIGKAEVPSLFN